MNNDRLMAATFLLHKLLEKDQHIIEQFHLRKDYYSTLVDKAVFLTDNLVEKLSLEQSENERDTRRMIPEELKKRDDWLKLNRRNTDEFK